MRPSLDSFKQASSNAFSKAQLMVGLNNSSTQNDDPRDDIELSNNNNSTDNNSNDNTNSDSGFRSSSFQRLFGHRGSEDDASSSSSLPGRGNNNNKDNSSSERTLMDEAADLVCPDLTFQQRLLGFVTCFTIAYLITFMSFKFFVQLIEGYPVPFALNYSVGNLMAMSASGFLCGPKRQFKNMFDSKRRTVSIVYLSCLCSTLVIVFIPLPWAIKLTILLTLLITQCCANIWYSLSYIPYGRKTALNFIKRYLGLNNSSSGEGFMGIVNSSGELS